MDQWHGGQMTYEEFNDFCRSLTAVSYVIQWGNAHVWKVGGKVFAIGGWEKSADQPAFTFKVSEQDFETLRDFPGFRPAPYFASRGMKWIQQYEPDSDDDDLKHYLEQSHRIVAQGLTKTRQKELGLT